MGVIASAAPARQALTDLAKQIHAEHLAAVAALRTCAEHAMAAGDLLIKAKRQVGHGQWGEWVEGSCKISARTARVYMQLAENRAEIESKRQHAADLDLSVRGALKLISGSPSKPRAHPTAAQPKPRNVPAQYSGASIDKSDSTAVHMMWALWDRLPSEERRRFFDLIGLSSILDNIPDHWGRCVQQKLDETMPTRALNSHHTIYRN